MSQPPLDPELLPPAMPTRVGPLPTAPPRWRRRPRRPWIHAGLFLLTALTTTCTGSFHYAGFMTDFDMNATVDVSFLTGAWYSVTILAILGTHEMGHYLACRYYGIDASLPYFLPAPWPIMTGTLGAVIRIRERIPTKPMLFDIGAAGPIAGFVVAVPALFIGMALSRIAPIPGDFQGLSLGEPLLFQFATWLFFGEAPEGYSVNLHPVGLASWFGLLVTAINLFPIGQLDGGHITYATLGRHSTTVTLLGTVAVIGLAVFVSTSWLFWALMMVVMLTAFGARHPQTQDEHVPLDPARRWVAVGTMLIFVLSFTPTPIEVLDLLAPPQ